MKILILAQIVTHSGVGVYIKSLAEELCRNGDEVHILSSIYDLKMDEKIKCHKFCSLKKSNIFKNYKIFKKVVKDNKIDVVHIQHRIVGIFPKMYNFIKLKVPCTYILHTAKLEQNNFFKRLLTYSGKKVIAISSEVYDCCRNSLKIDSKKIKIVYNGVDETKLKCITLNQKNEKKISLGIGLDKIVICIHGRIDYVKGHDILIESLMELTEIERNKLHIVVSGSTNNNAYYDEINKRICNLGIKNMFTFVGWCEPQDILSISDLMVQPSRREGFPLSTIEAFFMKVPVIRSKTGGYNDMKELCVATEIEDIIQLKNEISRFIKSYIHLNEKDNYIQMVNNAYEFANSNCSIKKMANNTRRVFEEIIDEN